MIPFSILDLAPIAEGADAAQALRSSVDLARHAERWGYRRFWLAEHHNMPGVASAATAVVMGHVAAGTSSIRIGAGGIMLPNHAPLVVAEQFGTLDALFPGRIDLGLGRAPGTDPGTARALRRGLPGDSVDSFPDDVVALLGYFRATGGAPDAGGPPLVPGARPVSAVPGAGAAVEPWILGSSLYGAQLAAALGLPHAFASHFAPAQLEPAIALYRDRFRPSPYAERPRLMLGVNVIAADDDAEAELLATTLKQLFLALRRGRPGRVPPPRADVDAGLTRDERAALAHVLACTFVGSLDTVRRGLEGFLARHAPDELIVSTTVFDHAARLRSYELTAEVRDAIAGRR